MIHKSLFGNAPLYLRDFIEVQLSNEQLLIVGHCWLFLEHDVYATEIVGFSVFGAKTWNSLPKHVRDKLDSKLSSSS